MKNFSKKLFFCSLVFSICAFLFTFGLSLQQRQGNVYAENAQGQTRVTLQGVCYGSELSPNATYWYCRDWGGGDGKFKHEDAESGIFIWSVTITNNGDFLDEYDESNGDYNFIVTGTPIPGTTNDEDLYCYVINKHDTNENVDYQDVYIYADVDVIYAPRDCKCLFAPFNYSETDSMTQAERNKFVYTNSEPAYKNQSQAGDWGDKFTLRKITFDSCFNTSYVENMSCFFGTDDFSNNLDLQEINGLEHFDTAKVKSVYMMFYGCSEITTLDLSSWDLSSIIEDEANDFFGRCTSLEKIYIPNSFNEFSANIVLPGTFVTYDYDAEESLSGSIFDFGQCSDDEYKQIAYKLNSNMDDGMYRVQKTILTTEETGVFVDIVLPAVFVALTGTLTCMYVLQARNQKRIFK